MRLYAFQGLHYAAAEGDQAAPPYDQIDSKLRDRLHAQSPHQFAHLTKPLPGASGDPYGEADALHRRWLAEGVIERDPRPALYPYVIELAGGGRRLALCGLAGFEEPGSGVIRPHEETLAKPLADRLALLRATQVDLEPILLTVQDGGGIEALLREDLEGAVPIAVHLDPAGNRHLLFRLAEPERVARYQELLAALPAAIADGHHRYKVGQRYASETSARPGSAAAAKLAVVDSLDAGGLVIDPIHRALAEPIGLDRLASLTTARRRWEGEGGSAFAASVARAPQPSLGVWQVGELPEIWTLDPAAAPEGTPPGAEFLTVWLLHGALFPALGLPAEAATDGTVLYRSDPNLLWDQVASGEAAVGLWLPPMAPEAFAAAIAHGDMLPPKSTRFLPKVVSGMVWAGHDAEVA
jgi:uncharacterized protein (DUF1015 family)